MNHFKTGSISFVLALLFLVGALGSSGCTTVISAGGGSGNGSGGSGGTGNPPNSLQVVFNPIGSVLNINLIDLEFLPGQDGELLVLGKDGTVYYLDNQFNLIATNSDFTSLVIDQHERGMQNVAAHPDYANNQMLYFFYTSNDGNPDDGEDDVNQVVRRTVNLNKGAGTLALDDHQVIVEYPKGVLGNSANLFHNGGGMVFDTWGNLIFGVGDGSGNGQISQDPTENLGKIHRLVPVATPGVGGFTLPTSPVEDLNEPNPLGPDTIYAYGVRNPFSLVAIDQGDQAFGDVGNVLYEEVNCIHQAGNNFGWPEHEGPSAEIPFITPIHGYAHGDETFSSQDPLADPGGLLAVMVSAYIEGPTAYGDDGLLFNRRIIYSDFYQGWVRALRIEENRLVSDDQAIGHLTGLTSLQFNPSDGYYYGVSLFGAEQILRMELAP